jgi:hypothetical protein
MPLTASQGVSMTNERALALEAVITTLTTYRRIAQEEGAQFDVWRDEAERELTRAMIVYLGASEAETIKALRVALRDALAQLEKVEDDLEVQLLKMRIRNELGMN